MEDRVFLPGSDGRPADVLIPNWTEGRDTALDVTVVNPLQAAMVDQAAVTAGHGLSVAYNRKMTKAGEACRKAGMVFIPMETLVGGTSRLSSRSRSWPLPRPDTQEETRVRPPGISPRDCPSCSHVETQL